jgi:hypothetical protein
MSARTYPDLLGHLSARSVAKHFDAYRDVPWDDFSIDPTDPRFELHDDEPLSGTAWYRALPRPTRARLGLHVLASMLKVGVEFESLLSRGLLELCSTLPNGSPEFRYAYHEVIEEGQHTLMFQEIINRTGLDVKGLSPREAWMATRNVPRKGRVFPEELFVHVIGGEWPIDHVQRMALDRERELHPIVRRVMQIHVTEEARHLCFASRFLEERVPRLTPLRRVRLRLFTPFIVSSTVHAMMRVPPCVIAEYGIPRSVVREAHASRQYSARVHDGLRPVRELCEQLGILTDHTRFLWRWLGIAP